MEIGNAWRVLEYQRSQAIAHWDREIAQWQKEKTMAFELSEGHGSLFGNNHKTKDTQPDWKGSVKIGGKTYRLAGWTKATKTGEPFYSLQVDGRDLPPSDGKDLDRAFEDEDVKY